MDFYDQSQKYSCILWRLDRKENAEDGAVFGIWGAEGPHAGLACRVVAQHRSSDRNNLPCLQNRTGEQLVQLLRNNRVYMAGIKEAERTLRQQLETGTPTWDTYGRWKFPEGVQSSTDSFGYDGVYARCAACYTCCTGKHRCEKTLRLRKLVLKPFRHRKFRVSPSLLSAVLLTNLSIRCLHIGLIPRLKMKNLYSSARGARMTL